MMGSYKEFENRVEDVFYFDAQDSFALSGHNGKIAANNTSAIIDTKIEQAMDLVKSHLMYTVREEVEVLKERIAVLLDRINQLEMENNFLKANATPEVLTALNNRALGAQAQGINPSIAGADGGSPSN